MAVGGVNQDASGGYPLQRFKDLLKAALDHSTFDVGHTEVRHGDVVTSFISRPEEVISPQRFRELLLETKWNVEGGNRLRRAKLICPDELLSQLEGHLQVLLNKYVDPDTNHIGYAFPSVVTSGFGWTRYLGNGMASISSASPLDVFAQGLVRASVVLGVENVISLVSGWMEGEPVKYRMSALLNELYISAPATPIHGVHIEPLPLSSDELPASLPRLGRLPASDYLGRTIVSIDCDATPALFRPPPMRKSPDIQVEAVPSIGINEICQALSLECDIHVDAGFFWENYLGLEDAFPFSGSSIHSNVGAHLRGSHPIGWSLNRDYVTGISTLTPAEGSMVTLREEPIQRTLRALMDPKSTSIRNAASRWAKSKDTSQDFEDQFIDLRIALESLYLSRKDNAELSFRLALSGAWHLGNSLEHRRKIYQTLREAYSRGSAAIHPRGLDNSQRNREILSDAQATCRRGILKMLEEGPPNWEDLLLGG